MGTFDLSSILIIVFVLIVDIALIVRDGKNKVIFSGNNKYRIIMPITVIIFIAASLKFTNFKLQDIVVLVLLIPLGFVGNKCGITEKGLLSNSYITLWDKVESYSLEDKGDKFIVNYKTNLGTRRVIFKSDLKDDVKKYLLSINKLRYRRK